MINVINRSFSTLFTPRLAAQVRLSVVNYTDLKQSCTELKGHWRLFVLVSSFFIFFWLRVLDNADYSAFESTLNSAIVSYRINSLC